jgi:hypothetical protein
MATAPQSRRLNLTRDQLATFLTDQQQIRQFELLFSTVDELQVITGTDFEYQADTAAATANEALAQISSLAQDTAVDDAVLNAKVQQALDAIPRLAQALDLLALAPMQQIGTISSQNANAVAITGGTINNTVIGGTTPAAGTFTTLIGGGGSANYFQTQGSATTKAVEVKALGSDSNIAFVIDSKGTGAIDLAAGSSGVNISNGGTVTAITRTNGGSTYTSAPTLTIAAPTTAGGVQATATFTMGLGVTPTVTAGGTGYTVGNTLTVVGGTGTAAVLTVSAVSAGAITAVTVSNFGTYSVLPSVPFSVTGGTGSSATFTSTFGVNSTFTITNAGSGYVEQPTVTFSGGGGSGAAAYASVGSLPIIRSLVGSGSGSASLSFYTASGEAVRITDGGGPSVNYWRIQGSPTNSGVQFQATGSDTNVSGLISSKGTSGLGFYTNTFGQQQFQISHTASAVNYVQVTGAATGSGPTISAQGSNADIDFNIAAKGTGNVRFGTYTAGVLVATGYITIKDSGGTTRRLLVG